MSDVEKPGVLSGWPVIVGLGVVALLIIGMIGVDVYSSQEEAFRTADIIENAQQSIVLLTDIRRAAKHLASASETPEVEKWRRAIEEASRSYDPIATYRGERVEWTHLQHLLGLLPGNTTGRASPTVGLEDAIDRSVGALVAINTVAGRGNASAIRAAHRQAIWIDVVSGGIVFTIVALIAVWLLRLLSRQRRLILERVEFLHAQNAELEAFAARAAHDLRGPMNPILICADLILKTPALPQNIATMAQRIRRAVERMARLVDDMLALSVSGRPPAGQSSTGVVISHVIEEMAEELREVDLATKLSGGEAACSEGVLSQILRNLIGNAIKFCAQSRPLRITIETRDVGPMVQIAIEDNGIGMDAETAKHVFEPFYRGPTDHRGHGLGLAIVERTTRVLAGNCELSSVPDRGTRITVRLPRP
jgi:signal transduction histidine kinase